MAKAILVMDMPETCKDCSCKYPSCKDDALYDCAITGKTIPINGGRYGGKAGLVSTSGITGEERNCSSAGMLRK